MAIETADTGSGDVTFLNGQAVEQETEGETHEGTDRGDELAEAKAAVKKALEEDAKEEGKKAAKEAKAHREKDPLVPRDRDADGKFVQADPVEADKEAAVAALKKEKAEADADASALKKALAERKELAKFKKEAADALEKERAEVRRVYAETQRQKQEIEQEKARIARYRKDPAQLAREAGYANPEDYILELAQEGTPEGQARRAQREWQERIEATERWQKQEMEARQHAQRQQQEHQERAHREQVERQFLTEASKHEALVEMYKGYEVELITQADTVAQQYRAATGQEATFAEIAEYIAERTERWYKNRMSKNGAKAASASSGLQDGANSRAGSPTQGSATGKKRPISASGGERRSLNTTVADLDGDERREMAMSAVRAAIAASGER